MYTRLRRHVDMRAQCWSCMASTAGDRGKSCDTRATRVTLVGAAAGIRCFSFGTPITERHIGSRSRRGSQVRRRAAFGSSTTARIAARRALGDENDFDRSRTRAATISQRTRASNAKARLSYGTPRLGPFRHDSQMAEFALKPTRLEFEPKALEPTCLVGWEQGLVV
jgi:hypothetical protein